MPAHFLFTKNKGFSLYFLEKKVELYQFPTSIPHPPISPNPPKKNTTIQIGFPIKALLFQFRSPLSILFPVRFLLLLTQAIGCTEMITKKINENIQVLYLARLAPRSSSFKESGDGKASTNQILSALNDVDIASINNVHVAIDAMVSIPFAMDNEIADASVGLLFHVIDKILLYITLILTASPATEDGLLLGDQIVKFGSVETGNYLLQRPEAQSNNGCAIPVVQMRQGTLVNIIVRPRTWQGRGQLGLIGLDCHFSALYNFDTIIYIYIGT
ncbi:hypothetical protein UlMin_042131 [Ulmus minor]